MANYPASSSAPPVNPASIIGPHFCAPYPIDVAITKKVLKLVYGNFVVTDVNGNIMFKVRAFAGIRHRQTLIDTAGNTIVTFKRKVLSAHDRWKVFRGDSSESKDLLYTVKRSSMFQLKTKLDVFLANNTRQDVCDFKVKEGWLKRPCVVYAGESSTIVAQMHKKHTVQSILFGKDKFNVTVYPNIDYAFIISLIVTLDGINYAAKARKMALKLLLPLPLPLPTC